MLLTISTLSRGAPLTTRRSSRNVTLLSKAIGPLPIINSFLKRLQLDRCFERFVPGHDKRLRLAPALGIGVLLRNILIEREPLYALHEWADRFDEPLLGLPEGAARLLNDDRVGRALDALFLADRAALLTDIVVGAVQAFDVDLHELHNNSTTVTFTGDYIAATGGPIRHRPTHRITHGHNKDHRPDLKQLLWILTTSADGTIPVWGSTDHGNTVDDQTHITTWNTLRRLVGNAHFLYVADAKLCTRENMAHIARGGGRFLTVLPKTRREDGWFRDWLQDHTPEWVELDRTQGARGGEKGDGVYRGIESPRRSAEGYRILWIFSSLKAARDRAARQAVIDRALEELEHLRGRLGSPKSRLTTRGRIEEAIAAILATGETHRWITVTVSTENHHQYTQAAAGRPGKDTQYIRKTRERFDIHWQMCGETLAYDDRTDGIFPFITNDETLSVREALAAYKRQPSLEKRHEQLKTVFAVMPVNLKSHSRIEAFLFLYFVALLVESLIERELRRRMKTQNLESLPLYPEGRRCRAPTAERVFDVFRDVRRHRLQRADGTVHQCFYDELTELQRTVLQLLGYSPKAYFHAGEDR